MTVNNQTTTLDEKPGAGRLIARGLVAGVLAVAANLLIYLLAPPLLNITLEFPLMGPGSPVQPLPFSMVVIATLVPALGAALLLAVLSRFSDRAVTLFRIIALVFLLLSLAGPLFLPVSFSLRAVLVSMHVITAAIILIVLTAGRR